MKGWGAKKFGMSLEIREIKLFGQDIPGFCWDIPAVPEKFEKNVCVQLLAHTKEMHATFLSESSSVP